MEITIRASEFKDKCLKLLKEVHRGDTYLITKRGKPLAKLVALTTEKKSLYGLMKHSFVENGDIIQSIDEHWEAENV